MADVEEVATVWDAVAPAWDASVDYVNDHAAEATAALLDGVDVHPGDRLVELAGGPGTMGARWSELVGPDGSVLVSDLAPAMVAAASRRLAGLANVDTARLDLVDIDRTDASADVAICRFGLMFVMQPEAAFAELYRILAPGGRLGAMTWAGMQHNPWVALVGMAVGMHGLMPGGPPIGPGGLFSLAEPDQLTALAEGAGFEASAVREVAVDFAAPDVDTHLDRVTSLAGPLASVWRDATAAQREAVRRSVADGAEQFRTGSGYVFPGRALVLSATRPAD